MKRPGFGHRRFSVPDAELAVLKVLWERREATIREITEVLYPDGAISEYATVQKLLDRLHQRKHVARRRRGRANVYVPTTARDDLIREHLHEAADRFCDGSLTPLLSQLVDGRHLTDDDLRALRVLVQRLDERRGRP
jgi:predicted transcriptional regulator